MAKDKDVRRRFLSGLALALAVALPGTACAAGPSTPAGNAPVDGTWQEIVAAAEKEGEVTMYSSQGTDQLEDLKARFEKKHPKIKLTLVRGTDADLTPKVEAERKTGKGIADLFIGASLVWIKANKDAYEAPRGPAFGAPAYRKATSVPDGSYFLTNAAILTFGWNTKLYKTGLKDYPDLLDPKLADGKIGVVKPAAPSFVDFYLYLKETYGADFVKKLGAQRPRIYPSSLPLAQALTSGEIAAAAFVQPLVDEKKAGAPVEWGLAKKAWGALFWGMALKSAPHPNAAQVLADFMVTEEGQQAIARKNSSVLPGIEGAVGDTGNVRRQDLSQLTPEKVRAYQAEWNEQFGA
ncbi:ABC transporter substrate-binding protein [Actinomadura sp. SCN-SB]|uniref:ABC transporter substrate-binding protein n=1 Tax=Actinomadura sp. SCN-SB TaxID=3373092 RepID=UPI0037502EF0